MLTRSVMRSVGVGTTLILFVIGCVSLLKDSNAFDCEGYKAMLQNNITSADQVTALFPTTPDEINQRCDASIALAQQGLQDLLAVPDEQRNFDNTVYALDEIERKFTIGTNFAQILNMVHPDKAIRDAAQAAVLKMQSYSVDAFMNQALYTAFKGMLEKGSSVHANGDVLSSEEQYHLDETMKEFKRDGFDLPLDQFERVKEVNKELSKLSVEFQSAIDQDNRFIVVTPQDLAGVSDDLLKRLAKTDDGNLKVGVDYPTYAEVMGHCKVGETRKKLSLAFNNRAYPDNIERLEKIIKKRDELAQLLNFASYAHLDTDSQMVKTPERAYDFLHQLANKAQTKAQREHELLITDLPDGVQLNEAGQFLPWDKGYAMQTYKKKHFSIDERHIAEYFPVDKTVQGIFDIYQSFLNVDFETVPLNGVWDKEVTCISVKDKGTGVQRGFVILDLYPRPNKYSHACCARLVPARRTTNENGITISPSVCIVIANFPRATDDKPALFKHSDVTTFFHEFGHAMHNVLGSTQLASNSGAKVKRDFVEMPSQMFEEWMWDKDILKNISSHYLSGEPLGEDLIDKKIALKRFNSGDFLIRQVFLSLIALEYFKKGAIKDTQAIFKELYEKYITSTQYIPDDHFQASFGHLTGYGAKYYGYMWSKVFALDLFKQIKQVGLLDSGMGQQFVDKVIGKGGGADPNDLLQDFLGRAPIQDAFFEDLGL